MTEYELHLRARLDKLRAERHQTEEEILHLERELEIERGLTVPRLPLKVHEGSQPRVYDPDYPDQFDA